MKIYNQELMVRQNFKYRPTWLCTLLLLMLVSMKNLYLFTWYFNYLKTGIIIFWLQFLTNFFSPSSVFLRVYLLCLHFTSIVLTYRRNKIGKNRNHLETLETIKSQKIHQFLFGLIAARSQENRAVLVRVDRHLYHHLLCINFSVDDQRSFCRFFNIMSYRCAVFNMLFAR